MELKRQIGLITAVLIIVADMIGTGIFTTTGYTLSMTQHGGYLLALWLIGGFIAITGTLSYAELAVMWPEDGGEYVYLKKIFGYLPAFLTGWISLMVGFSASIALAALALIKYLDTFLTTQGIKHVFVHAGSISFSGRLLAAFIIVTLGLFHLMGVKRGALVQNILTVFKIILVLALILAGFIAADWSKLDRLYKSYPKHNYTLTLKGDHKVKVSTYDEYFTNKDYKNVLVNINAKSNLKKETFKKFSFGKKYKINNKEYVKLFIEFKNSKNLQAEVSFAEISSLKKSTSISFPKNIFISKSSISELLFLEKYLNLSKKTNSKNKLVFIKLKDGSKYIATTNISTYKNSEKNEIKLVLASKGKINKDLIVSAVKTKEHSPDFPLLALALLMTMFAYAGWNGAVYIGGEIKNPAVNLPRALFWGTFITIILYIGLNIVFLMATNGPELFNVEDVISISGTNLFGSAVSSFFTLGIVVILLSAVSAQIMVGPRIYFAMAKDKMLFSSLTKIHPKYQTPHVAIIVQILIAASYVFIGSIKMLIIYMGFALNIFPVLSVIGLMYARYKFPDMERKYKVPFYPVLPLLYVILTIVMMAAALLSWTSTSFFAIAMVLVGIPIFFIWKKFANPENVNN